MEFTVEPDPHRFAERVMAVLEGAIEHNLPATILRGVVDGRIPGPPPVLAHGTDGSGDVVAVALRAEPRPMICTALPDPDRDAGALLDAWLPADPGLTAVSGPDDTARALADALARRRPSASRPVLRLATELHALTNVTDPLRPSPGTLREASEDDDELILEWLARFAEETGAALPHPSVALRHHRQADSLWLWVQEDERPVCLVAAHPPVAGIPRVAPVYTPPADRRRGYAGSAVAEVSRRLLARGARACGLFTVRANPTSNRIYREVGYRPVGGWEEYTL